VEINGAKFWAGYFSEYFLTLWREPVIRKVIFGKLFVLANYCEEEENCWEATMQSIFMLKKGE